jgi:hypothetical protein
MFLILLRHQKGKLAPSLNHVQRSGVLDGWGESKITTKNAQINEQFYHGTTSHLKKKTEEKHFVVSEYFLLGIQFCLLERTPFPLITIFALSTS